MSQTVPAIPTPPTDDPTKLLGWFVGLLLALAAFLWRTIEKGRADLKIAHEREIGELKASHARETATLKALLERAESTVEKLGGKCDAERKRYEDLVERVAGATLSRRRRLDEPEESEAEMPTVVRERIAVVPRSHTPPGTRSPGRYRGPGE